MGKGNVQKSKTARERNAKELEQKSKNANHSEIVK